MFEQSFFKVAKTIRNTFRISYQSEKLSQYMDFKKTYVRECREKKLYIHRVIL